MVRLPLVTAKPVFRRYKLDFRDFFLLIFAFTLGDR